MVCCWAGAQPILRAQPMAAFTSSTTLGCTPVEVQFSDQSTANPTSWLWDFGDGTTSTLKNPVKVYFAVGMFTVSLTVSNALGNGNVTKPNLITVKPIPTSEFSASPVMGCFPLTVNFADLSFNSAGGPTLNWKWSFGDGNFSTLQNPSHTYTDFGDFDVSLYVENTSGCAAILNKNAFIKVGDKVKADFDTTMQPYCKLPKTINFVNVSAGSGSLTYAWDFGDGTGSNLSNPVHNYTSFGTYTVKLIAISSFGCSDTIIKTNYVKADSIVTDFSFPVSACITSVVRFNNLSAPANVKSSWNFGDGTGSNVFSPLKQYSSTGNYSVVLTNRFANGCVDSIRKTINIVTNLAVAFNNSLPVKACRPPLTVSFTDATPGGSLQQWDFGDGSTGSGSPISHTYTLAGSYNVKLIVTNGGCKDSLIKAALVVILPPQVTIGLTETGGCVPFTLTPVANVTSTDAVTGFSWDFGDGATSTSPSPSHSYTTVGVYTLRLIVTTTGGCTDTALATIRVGNQPVIGFSISPNPVCAKKATTFTDASPLGSAILWDFGDGTSAISRNAIHYYAKPGVFSILLRVDNGGCTRDTILNNYVTVLPPSGEFSFNQDCNNKFLFNFDASASLGANSYQWDFGDGTNGTGSSPSHLYGTSGTFMVSMVTTNATCTDTIKKVIIAGASSTDFRVSATTSCRRFPLVFTANYKTPSYVNNYQWDFGDGTSATVRDSVIQHAYPLSGTYTVRLVVVNIFGCVDTVTKQNFIVISGPKAGFGVVNPTGCTRSTVSFSDSSTSDGVNAITNWRWDFGDGIIQSFTAPPFTYVYAADGIYSVKLTVTDALGCKDSIIKENLISNSRPVISFSSEDTLSCPSARVVLIANDPANNLSHTWNTGIGFVNGDTAVVAYPDSGRYTIRLYATDGNGCRDSLIKVNYISIKKPVAAFSLSDSISICPPLRVKFTNKSYYFSRVIWDFDNGNSTFQQNPFVPFPAGTYQVKLKVTSPGGCVDSAIKRVQVFPFTTQFSYQPLAGCQPLAVTFKLSTPSRGSMYKWDFNDGTFITTTDSFVTKKYRSFGPYQPRVFFTEQGTNCLVQVGSGAVINVFGTIANFGVSDSIFCGSGVVSFRDSAIATGPITYRWIFGDGGISTQQNPTYTYATPGRYTVQQIVSTGSCSDTMTKINAVIINPNPRAFILGDSVGCQPFQTTFTPRLLQQDTAAISYSWDFGNGQTSTLRNPPMQLYPMAGNFMVTLRTVSSNGCVSDTSKRIIVNALPAINAGNDTTVCVNTPVTLRATGADTYRWLPPTNSQLSCTNCANPVATLASPSERYYVQGTTSFGCQGTDSVHIQYLPAYSVTAGPPADSICVGQSVQLTAAGAQLYTWTPATGLSSTTIANPVASPAVSTIYRLVATDTLGCQTFTRDIPISVFPYPTVNAGPDVTISGGASTVLNAMASADAILYRWTPTSQLSCTDCLSTTATPKATTRYTITVSNGGNCSAGDTVTVTVLCNNSNVFIPNTFSPNGDGMNDIFYPRGTGLYSIKSLRIFGRWGEMVFGRTNMAPNDPSQGWDGSYKGSRAATDVYTYIAEIYCENNTIVTINGTINLIY